MEPPGAANTYKPSASEILNCAVLLFRTRSFASVRGMLVQLPKLLVQVLICTNNLREYWRTTQVVHERKRLYYGSNLVFAIIRERRRTKHWWARQKPHSENCAYILMASVEPGHKYQQSYQHSAHKARVQERMGACFFRRRTAGTERLDGITFIPPRCQIAG